VQQSYATLLPMKMKRTTLSIHPQELKAAKTILAKQGMSLAFWFRQRVKELILEARGKKP
jgi:hypothetical protein